MFGSSGQGLTRHSGLDPESSVQGAYAPSLSLNRPADSINRISRPFERELQKQQTLASRDTLTHPFENPLDTVVTRDAGQQTFDEQNKA